MPIKGENILKFDNYNIINNYLYIMYLDANYLSGWTMSQYLPTGGFKWMTEKEIGKMYLGKYTEGSEKV